MSKITPIITNFTAGELSPQLEGRTDVARYNNAVSTLENFLVAQFGGGDRRPGSVFVAPAKFPDKLCRIIPFEFSTIQAYTIEMGEGYFRFYRENAAITEADKVISGATQADPVNLTIAAHGYSVGDEIIINDIVGMTELNGKRFRVLGVPGAANITLEDLDGVSLDGTGFTAYISGGVSSKIVEIANPYTEDQLLDIQFSQTADLLYFTHIEVPIQKLTRSSDTAWTLVAPDIIGGPFQSENITAITVSSSATAIGAATFTASSPIFSADMVDQLFSLAGTTGAPAVQGYAKITAFTSSTIVDVDIIQTLSSGAATDVWAFGSFGVNPGFPTACGFHEQRFYVGATTLEPSTLFGSQILEFENFTAGEALDNEALKFEIATEQVNAIRWLNSGRGLAIGTAGGAFIASSGADFITLTPTNISIRRETTFGAQLIIAKRIGNFLYYVQRGARKMREFSYNFDIDSHLSLDMTLLSEQISESGWTVMDFQQSPHPILWCVRSDGQMSTMTRQSDQEVIAWSRQVTAETIAGAGSYESVASIPKGEEDQVWVTVKRTVDGTTRRFIEFFSPIDFGILNDAFFVDSGLSYAGASTQVLTGLDHLEGETVTILNEGAVEPDRTVTNGQITLDSATTRAHVGLAYTSSINTLKLEGGSNLGTAQGKIARINEVTFKFFKTVGAIFGREGVTNQIFFRNTGDPMDTAVPLFTGDKRVQFPKGYDREPRVFIKQEQPLPMTVLAIMPLYEVFEQ